MSTMFKKLKATKVLAFLLAAVIVIPLLKPLIARAQSVSVPVYGTDFEIDSKYWKSFYGGTISRAVANPDSPQDSSNYSLRMTGRTKSWHSPGINIYNIVRENGPAKYTFSMKVLVQGLNPDSHNIGLLVRTVKDFSFINRKYDGLFYCRMPIKQNIKENEWITLTGSMTVREEDIKYSDGVFNLMIDNLEPVSGQKLYIDDVFITATYTDTDFTLSKDNVNLCIGETQTISLSPYSSPYTAKYSTANNEIAVASDGKILGLSEGTTTVFVTRAGVTKTCTVNVSAGKYTIGTGQYYFRNVQTQKYMQIDEDDEKNGYTSSKVVMELWDFDNSSQHQHQLWTVTHLGDGYYKIISVISGKALSVKYGEQNTENTALIQEDYKGLYRQQWMFVHLENGNFKIKPKSSLNSANDLCAVAGIERTASNGRRVEQGKYVADSLYTDEWSVMFYDIYNASRVVKVDVLYDFGFAQRYGGRTYQVIGTQLTELNRFFKTGFGIHLDFNIGVLYETSADQCEKKKYNERCECVDDNSCLRANGSIVAGTDTKKEYHHKNANNILNELQGTDGESCVRILFSGHYMCYISNNEHNPSNLYGLAMGNQNKCLITGLASEKQMKSIVFHEFGHLFNAPDHYDREGENTTEKRNRTADPNYQFDDNCIYGKNHLKEDIAESLSMCAGCRKAIWDNIEKYNHK